MQLRQKNRMVIQNLLIPLLIFAIAAFVYSQYGFRGQLGRDEAVYLYSGQRMAQGVPPYVSIFEPKGPLAFMFPGVGVMISKQLGWDDIYTVRLVFFIISCFAVVSVYLLGNSLFQSRRAGGFAAFAFLGFFGFAKHAAGAGPREKTPMVFLETLSLLLTTQRKWFLAGLCGSLSSLTYQPTAIFPLVTLILAAVQPRKERIPAISRALAGIGLPVVVISAYFHHYGALYELLDGTILFAIRYLDRGEYSFISHILTLESAIFSGYATMLLPIFIGLIMVVYIYFWRRSLNPSFRDTLTKDLFAPILLSFPAPVVWSLLDFQGYPDFYVFLPYIAIGLAKFLDLAVQQVGTSRETTLREGAARFLTIGLCIALIASAWINLHLRRESRLDLQKEAAIEIEERFGKDVKLLSIGVPEILVILHRANPTQYVHIISGIDRRIHANTPGGFEGWLQELEAYDPEVIAFGQTEGIHTYKLMDWLKSRYHEEEIGPWKLYVRDSLDD